MSIKVVNDEPFSLGRFASLDNVQSRPRYHDVRQQRDFMRFLIFLAFVASVFALKTSSLSADVSTEKLHVLEGELRVHPKDLYKYYVVFGDGQKCALYSSEHKREDKSLAVMKPGARVRVRGILGTAFHRSTATKGNPSPFDSTWIMYMDVNKVELVGSPQRNRRKAAPVKVGMTFQDVLKARDYGA